MKFIIYSVIAVLAIVAAVVAFRISDNAVQSTAVVESPETKPINVRTVDVLVARTNVSVGTVITSDMIDRQPWPENLVLDGFILRDEGGDENIVGKVSRSPIMAHEPFMKSKLANPNDPGFLAANLTNGMRAITVATDAISGIAGFIFPGDRVDLLFTHEPIPSNGASGKPEITEVIGANVKVLAVNIRDIGDGSKPANITPSSVTLEVSDVMAQQIRLAEKNGTLSFSLRSLRDESPSTGPTNVSDLSSAASTRAMTIIRGPGQGKGGKMNYDFPGSVSKSSDERVPANMPPSATPAPVAKPVATATGNNNTRK